MSYKKEKNMDLSIGNSAYFEKYKIYQILSFLCSPEFKEICITILHACGIPY
jgi:hypothetical protein